MSLEEADVSRQAVRAVLCIWYLVLRGVLRCFGYACPFLSHVRNGDAVHERFELVQPNAAVPHTFYVCTSGFEFR